MFCSINSILHLFLRKTEKIAKYLHLAFKIKRLPTCLINKPKKIADVFIIDKQF